MQQKEEIKKKTLKRQLNLTAQCKLHGGPVTHDDIGLIDTLNRKQLISEIRLLRLITAAEIKERSKSGPFTEEQLRNQIKNVLKPESEPDLNLDHLVNSFFQESLGKLILHITFFMLTNFDNQIFSSLVNTSLNESTVDSSIEACSDRAVELQGNLKKNN